MKFQIVREKWLRGEGANGSALYKTENGRMCCLGFKALACGYTISQIEECGSPSGLVSDTGGGKGLPLLLGMEDLVDPSLSCEHFTNSIIATELMIINDRRSADITESERERKITTLFHKIGDEVEFIDACFKIPNQT